MSAKKEHGDGDKGLMDEDRDKRVGTKNCLEALGSSAKFNEERGNGQSERRQAWSDEEQYSVNKQVRRRGRLQQHGWAGRKYRPSGVDGWSINKQAGSERITDGGTAGHW